jgi:sucrose phosphorylase
VYFHSLLGTPNDMDGVRQTGRARSINRRKYTVGEVLSLLKDANSKSQRIFSGYCQMLRARTTSPAFHPAAYQEVLPVAEPFVIAFVRTSLDDRQRILVIANVANTTVSVQLPEPFRCAGVTELLWLGAAWQTPDSLQLSPAGVAWLATSTGP